MNCLKCGAQVAGAYLCHRDTVTLETALDDVPWLLTELAVTVHRQDRTGAKSPARAGGRSLPVNLDAADALHRLRGVLIRQARARDAYVSTARDAARWLRARTNTIRTQPDALEVHDTITAAVRAAMGVIDLPPDKSLDAYLGACGKVGAATGNPCPHQLWAREFADTVTCPRCNTTWSVEDRQGKGLAAARETLGTAEAVSRALTTHKLDVPAARIRQWKARGLLVPREADDGRNLYRVGDVLDLLEEQQRREWKGK